MKVNSFFSKGGRLPSVWAIVALTAFVLPLQAQQYSISWYKASGGGGTCRGGPYAISGTIGQHDAGGPMTGGNYALTGGFWAVYAVETPSLPKLTVKFVSPSTVQVSWPYTGNYTLQQKSNLAAGSWMTSGYVITTAGGTSSITVTTPAGNLFFRLKSP